MSSTQRRVPNIWKQSDVVIGRGLKILLSLVCTGRSTFHTDWRNYRKNLTLHKEQQQQQGLHPDQYDFRKGRSTKNAVNRAMDVVHAINAKYVLKLFIDIKGVFDNPLVAGSVSKTSGSQMSNKPVLPF